MDYSTNTVFLKNLEDPKQPPKQFSFDGVYNVDSITETIYNDVGFPLVESVSMKKKAIQFKPKRNVRTCLIGMRRL
jgi:hypothetical protein